MADARGLLALTRASGDLGDSGSELARSAATLLQTDIVRTVLEIRKEADPEVRAGLLAKLTRAQADIGRLSIAAEKWQRELAAKVQAVVKAVSEIGQKAGTPTETLADMCHQIYGMMPK
jgi:hypothetical protein